MNKKLIVCLLTAVMLLMLCACGQKETPADPQPGPEVKPPVSDAPTQPVEPSKPAEPAQPTEPVQPTEPSKPAEPTQPTEPSKPAEPDPVQPVEPGKPAEPTQPTEPAQPAEPTKPAEPSKPDEPAKPAATVVYTTASPADLVAVAQNGGEKKEYVLTLGNFSWIYKDYKGDMETNKLEGLKISQMGVLDLGSYSLSTLTGIKLQLPDGVTAVKQTLYDASGNVVKNAADKDGFISADPGTYTYELLATYNNGSSVQYMARITYTK